MLSIDILSLLQVIVFLLCILVCASTIANHRWMASNANPNQNAQAPTPTDIRSISEKYRKCKLNPLRMKELTVLLEQYMVTEKPYLEMTTSANTVAQALGIAPHELSRLLSQQLHSSFYEYINKYRISYFLANLYRIERKEISILALAYESGFNAKSTFNKYFKKATLMSPSMYIKSQTTCAKGLRAS